MGFLDASPDLQNQNFWSWRVTIHFESQLDSNPCVKCTDIDVYLLIIVLFKSR